MVTPGAGQAMIRTGVNVGYSDEFRDRETNDAAAGIDRRAAGQARRAGQAAAAAAAMCRKTPRRPSKRCSRNWRSIRSAATCRRPSRARTFGRGWCWRRAACFLPTCSSAACRSISSGLCRSGRGSRKSCCGASGTRPRPETMSRLRSRKAEVDRSIESRRAATRFEPDADRADRSERDRRPPKPSRQHAAQPPCRRAEPTAEAEPRRRLHVAAAQSQETSLARPTEDGLRTRATEEIARMTNRRMTNAVELRN